MTQSFKQNYIGRVCQVKGAQSGVGAHRYSDCSIFMLCYKVSRKSCCLLPEDKHILVTVLRLRIYSASLGGCQKQSSVPMPILFHEGGKAFVNLQLHIGPVIKTGSFKALIIYFKSQRLNQMEHRVCCCTGSGDVSRVGRYFGFNEYYMQRHFIFSFLSFRSLLSVLSGKTII